MFIKNLLCLFSITISLPALSEIRFPEIPSKSQPLSISLQTEFFRSQANYTDFGQYVDLPDNNFFQYISFRPVVSYSPFQHYISFSFFANSFFSSSKSGDSEYLLPFRLSLIGAGVRFYHKIQTLFIGLELRGGFPLYRNFQNPQEIIVGDNAYFAEPGLWFIFQPSKMFYIYKWTAFRWRSLGLSSLLFSSLGGVLESEFISAGLSLDSFFSLFLYDHFSVQTEQRLSLLKTANAGSHKFYSVNPSVLSGTAWVEFKFNPFLTALYVNLDTLGQNFAKGFSLGLITKFQWSTKSSFISKKRKNEIFLDLEEGDWEEKETSIQKEEEKTYFEEEDDSSLFQQNNTQNTNQELKDELNLLTEE
ncbi:MAG: hypothetical protein OXN83_01510 [Oligoflexia bacterium]|nr:hypothetical protein [Oligoflexia bacterium]